MLTKRLERASWGEIDTRIPQCVGRWPMKVDFKLNVRDFEDGARYDRQRWAVVCAFISVTRRLLWTWPVVTARPVPRPCLRLMCWAGMFKLCQLCICQGPFQSKVTSFPGTRFSDPAELFQSDRAVDRSVIDCHHTARLSDRTGPTLSCLRPSSSRPASSRRARRSSTNPQWRSVTTRFHSVHDRAQISSSGRPTGPACSSSSAF